MTSPAERSARGIYHAASGSTITRELADLVASAAGIDMVEPWTSEALLSELGTTSQPPRVNVHSDVDGGRATNELGLFRLVGEHLGVGGP